MRFAYFWGITAFVISIAVQADNSGSRSICEITPANQPKIDSCLRRVTSKACEDVPTDMRKNCFSEYNQDEFNFARSCAVDGTKKFVSDTVEGIRDMASRGYEAVTNLRAYKNRVSKEAQTNCRNDREVKDANERFNSIVRNIGPELAYARHARERDLVYMRCLNREQRKGEALGVSFEIPDVDVLTDMFQCMNSHSQTEFGCSVVLPALASGGYGGVKALLAANKARKLSQKLNLLNTEYDKYFKKVSDRLTPAELASLQHQKDLLDAVGNPEIASRIGLSEAQLKGLTQGIIDSDAGKLKSFSQTLTTDSPDSNRLFDVLKGNDNSSAAGKAFQEFMSENNMNGLGLLNKDLSNEQLREVFSKVPATQGFLHELPGMLEAIRDVNAGTISPTEFKTRLGANLFHNGPQAGFWSFFTETLMPGAFKGAAKGENPPNAQSANNFFKNTAFQGNVDADGFVQPRYPSPVTKEGMIHTMFDRLSQATSGGNGKILLENYNGLISANPKIAMGELINPKSKIPALDFYRATLVGKPPGLSNGENTVKQFAELTKTIQASNKLTPDEKIKLTQLVQASRDRTLAFDTFVKQNADFVSDANGNVIRINFKDSNGQYIGTVGKDTPADQAQAVMQKFYDKEELLNGHPMKDLMKPRQLTNAEKLAYGKSAALGYFYCDTANYTNGKLNNNSSSVNSNSSPNRSQPTSRPRESGVSR